MIRYLLSSIINASAETKYRPKGLKTKAAFTQKTKVGKLKLVCVCERHKNSRQIRFYLTPTVCKRVCRLFLCRSHTPTWVCQHEFANLSLPCEGRLKFESPLKNSAKKVTPRISKQSSTGFKASSK